MKKIAVFLIRLYQKCISPLKVPCCRFTPTCSAYAIEAYQNRGFFVGFFLSTRRILKCNPFFHGGYDPVPYGHRFKRIDLFCKKMGEKQGESSAISVEKHIKRKEMLPYIQDGHC